MPKDIRLVYIGSAHKAITYARGHVVPEPRPDQIIAIQDPTPLTSIPVDGLPYWCHIATELHVTSSESRPAVADPRRLFKAAAAPREPTPKPGCACSSVGNSPISKWKSSYG